MAEDRQGQVDESEPSREASAVPDAPVRKVAVIGEICFAGAALVRALGTQGLIARVLCPDDESEGALSQIAFPESATRPVEIVRGNLDSPSQLAEVMSGTYGAAFVSPITLHGRMYRPQSHLEDLKRALEAAQTAALRKFVYHSALGAELQAEARALREAAEAELLMKGGRAEDFCLRTGPLMGPRDGFLSEILRRARSRSCVMGILGYGTNTLQPLHVRDMSRCCVRFFTPGDEDLQPGVYYAAGPELVTELDLLDMALERLSRWKLKFHAPLFVLRPLANLRQGTSFEERVKLLRDVFSTQQNDVKKLLGPATQLLTVKQAQEEVLAGA